MIGKNPFSSYNEMVYYRRIEMSNVPNSRIKNTEVVIKNLILPKSYNRDN